MQKASSVVFPLDLPESEPCTVRRCAECGRLVSTMSLCYQCMPFTQPNTANRRGGITAELCTYIGTCRVYTSRAGVRLLMVHGRANCIAATTLCRYGRRLRMWKRAVVWPLLGVTFLFIFS